MSRLNGLALAIENGAVYYAPKTGRFTWVERRPVEVRKVAVDPEDGDG
jgi:hypothetical protein